jgi:hypothetical protein
VPPPPPVGRRRLGVLAESRPTGQGRARIRPTCLVGHPPWSRRPEQKHDCNDHNDHNDHNGTRTSRPYSFSSWSDPPELGVDSLVVAVGAFFGVILVCRNQMYFTFVQFSA